MVLTQVYGHYMREYRSIPTISITVQLSSTNMKLNDDLSIIQCNFLLTHSAVKFRGHTIHVGDVGNDTKPSSPNQPSQVVNLNNQLHGCYILNFWSLMKLHATTYKGKQKLLPRAQHNTENGY